MKKLFVFSWDLAKLFKLLKQIPPGLLAMVTELEEHITKTGMESDYWYVVIWFNTLIGKNGERYIMYMYLVIWEIYKENVFVFYLHLLFCIFCLWSSLHYFISLFFVFTPSNVSNISIKSSNFMYHLRNKEWFSFNMCVTGNIWGTLYHGPHYIIIIIIMHGLDWTVK